MSFDAKRFSRQKRKDTNQCVLDVNDNTISNEKRYPARFLRRSARSLLEVGVIQLSRGSTQEESGKVSSELKSDASEIIENTIADDRY